VVGDGGRPSRVVGPDVVVQLAHAPPPGQEPGVGAAHHVVGRRIAPRTAALGGRGSARAQPDQRGWRGDSSKRRRAPSPSQLHPAGQPAHRAPGGGGGCGREEIIPALDVAEPPSTTRRAVAHPARTAVVLGAGGRRKSKTRPLRRPIAAVVARGGAHELRDSRVREPRAELTLSGAAELQRPVGRRLAPCAGTMAARFAPVASWPRRLRRTRGRSLLCALGSSVGWATPRALYSRRNRGRCAR
jgi:hypothetical protein